MEFPLRQLLCPDREAFLCVCSLFSLPLALTTLSREDLIAWFVTAQEGTSLLISLLLGTDPGTHQELPGKMGQYDTVHVASN